MHFEYNKLDNEGTCTEAVYPDYCELADRLVSSSRVTLPKDNTTTVSISSENALLFANLLRFVVDDYCSDGYGADLINIAEEMEAKINQASLCHINETLSWHNIVRRDASDPRSEAIDTGIETLRGFDEVLLEYADGRHDIAEVLVSETGKALRLLSGGDAINFDYIKRWAKLENGHE